MRRTETGCHEPVRGGFSAALQRFAAQRVLVLIDACHSAGAGSFKGGRAGEPPALGYSEKSLARLAQGTGRVLIAPSRATEESLVFSNARNSVFTSHLLDALRGQAWTRGDGVIRVFEIFNHISEKVKGQVPGQQHPVFKASDLEDNFPVALDRGGVKSSPPPPAFAANTDIWNQLGDLMPDLYPAGPTDQEIWARAGGDPSRLHLNDTGRVAWFRALRMLRRGGGGSGIRRETLIRIALEDYPPSSYLVRTVVMFRRLLSAAVQPNSRGNSAAFLHTSITSTSAVFTPNPLSGRRWLWRTA